MSEFSQKKLNELMKNGWSYPSGSRPDYAQGDETAVDFVKNKPCYHHHFENLLDKVSYAVIRTNTNVAVHYGSMNEALCNNSNPSMPEGVCIRVRVAGTEYMISDIPPLVNRQYTESVELDNGVVLRLTLSAYSRGSTKADRKSYYYCVIAHTTDDTLVGEEYTIEMFEPSEELKKLDSKFLPNVSDLDATWLAELKTALGIS